MIALWYVGWFVFGWGAMTAVMVKPIEGSVVAAFGLLLAFGSSYVRWLIWRTEISEYARLKRKFEGHGNG